MINYFLNDDRIPAPLQLDGLTLKKSRSRRYWGFLYRKLGYVDGQSNLRFEDPDVLALLNASLDRYGVQAETAFRMEQAGAVLYDGFVDYATFREDPDGVQVGLRDDRAVMDLETQAATVFALDSSETLSLHTRRIGGLAALITDASRTVQRTEFYAVPIDHSVPLTRRVEDDQSIAGSPYPVITPLAGDPCYYNTTQKDQTVHVSGPIVVTVTVASTITIELRLAQVGKEPEAITIGRWSVNATPQTIDIAVDAQILINVGAAMKLYWVGSSSVNRFSFAYDAQTAISLADDPDVGGSLAYGLSASTLFRSLVERATAGALSFKSNFLESDPDGRLFLANGAGVRGINKPLSTSMQTIFEALSAEFCLALWVDGTTVRLERRANRPKTTSTLSVISSRTGDIATEFLYNSVQAGYANWQADDSSLSADEPNGLRTYSTGITTIRNELNLTSELITASNLLEQQRRRQFDEKTASESKADAADDKLFLIAAVAAQAETLQRTDTISGVYDPATVYNVRLTPGRCLSRWSDWLAASLPLRAESVQGSADLITIYDGELVAEAAPLAGHSRAQVPRLVTVTAPCSMTEYSQLGDWIEYPYNGRLLTGELLDAEWHLTNAGETVTLQLLER